MKIAIIGASGFVGSALLKEALQRGHTVTGIVRHPEKITVKDHRLTVKKGDAFKKDEIKLLVAGHDMVISAYNPGWTNPDIFEHFLAASKSIQQGVKESGVKRYLVIGGAGSLEVSPGVQLIDTPQFPAEYKAGASAARDYLNLLKKEDGLDWTFFSPAIEMHHGITTGRTGKYRLGTDQPVFNNEGRSILSVEDLAIAVIDEVENKKFIRKRFTAAY
jgi:uncharacterized protein